MGFNQISTVLILGMINILVIIFVVSLGDWDNFSILLVLLAFSVVLSIILGVNTKHGAAHSVPKAKARA
jgi:ABC-type proline/glycine betaine transport system permease subunit